MQTWYLFNNEPPICGETVLCLLNNGQQVTLAFDQNNEEWFLYEGERLEEAIVIAWTELETKEKIEEQLGIKKFNNHKIIHTHESKFVSQKP